MWKNPPLTLFRLSVPVSALTQPRGSARPSIPGELPVLRVSHKEGVQCADPFIKRDALRSPCWPVRVLHPLLWLMLHYFYSSFMPVGEFFPPLPVTDDADVSSHLQMSVSVSLHSLERYQHGAARPNGDVGLNFRGNFEELGDCSRGDGTVHLPPAGC